MIYRADIYTINYLISSRRTGRANSYCQSFKDGAKYILIDYFDWLDYIIKANNPKNTINPLMSHIEIYNACKPIINILKEKLTREALSEICDKNISLVFQGSVKSIIELLCYGYAMFSKEVEALQIFYTKKYDYNNSHYPIIVIPFSFGLNRLATAHYNFYEEEEEEGQLLDVKIGQGYLKDVCMRSPIDFGIRTYTFFKKVTKVPYDIPSWFRIAKSFDEESRAIAHKVTFLSECYSQYCYTGFNKSLTKVEKKDDNALGEGLFSTLFLLNFPFLLPNMLITDEVEFILDKFIEEELT